MIMKAEKKNLILQKFLLRRINPLNLCWFVAIISPSMHTIFNLLFADNYGIKFAIVLDHNNCLFEVTQHLKFAILSEYIARFHRGTGVDYNGFFV